MSDEQTPDVTVDAPVEPADAPEAAAPAETADPQTFRRGKGRRGKARASSADEEVGEGEATPAADAPATEDDEVVLVDPPANDPEDAPTPDADGEAVASDEAPTAEGADAAEGDPYAGELKEPELFDPAEVANAPRAPHPLKPVVEALIFASPEPLTVKAMARLLEEHTKEDIETALAEVRETYLKSDGLQLVEVAGGYQIVTRPELYEWVRRLFKERTTSKLSVQALETLAVIAYKQPVTSGEIAEIRGVSATTGVLNTLLDRKLVKIVGRKQVVGRPFMYGTTREFLDKFGLKDLSDLPKVEDMSEALGFDLPSPVDEGDGTSLPFEGPVEPLLFDESKDLVPVHAAASADAGSDDGDDADASASDDGSSPDVVDAGEAHDSAPTEDEGPQDAPPDDDSPHEDGAAADESSDEPR